MFKKLATKRAAKIFGLLSLWIVSHKIYHKIYRYIKRHPKGPMGIPLFGSMLHAIMTSTDLNSYNIQFLRKFNPYIAMQYVGYYRQVVIFNAELAKIILSNKNCQNRDPISFRLVASDVDVLRIPYNEQWKLRRKLIRSTLLTMENSNYVEINVVRLINKYIDKRINKNGVIFESNDALQMIKHIGFNMILKTMFGVEMDNDDPMYRKLSDLYDNWGKAVSVSYLLNMLFRLPIFRYVMCQCCIY